MSNRRLLLADDSLTIQKVVNLTFSDEGFDVQTVGDGDSALAAIRDTRPDIVLADVNMPGADGYTICETLRNDGDTARIPVILLVGSFEPFDEERAGSVGADAFLTKPFQSIRQLISQVNELLEPTPTDAAPSDSEFAANGGAPQDEPITEAVPSPPADDIDNLYAQSFATDSSEIADDLGQTIPNYEDSGLDDEMIETSYLAGNEDRQTLDFEIAAGSEGQFDQQESDRAPEVDHYFPAADQPVSGYESESLDPFSMPADQAESSGELSAVETTEQTAPDTETNTSEPIEGSYDSDLSERAEYGLVDKPEIGQSQMGIETVSFDAPQQSRGFDEIDLLDIPPMGSSETVELTTAERAEIMGSDKQAISISPELMELIVERVVERLSRKY